MKILLLAAAVAQTFNLNCTGTHTVRTLDRNTTEPFTHTYRIDLGKAKWCEQECRHLFDFADIGPTQLTFLDKDEVTALGRDVTMTFVSRETGAYHSLSTLKGRLTGIIILKWEGQCEKADFTGFPEFETKF